MKQINNLAIFGNPIEESAVKQIQTCMATGNAIHGALMADHHKGYACPIGGVVARRDEISPSEIGFDIACGNKAVKLDVDAKHVTDNISAIMDRVMQEVSFGVGRKNNAKVEHDLFDSDFWELEAVKPLKKMAQEQLGTVGSGNHYVDIFIDQDNFIWVGCHFGSRGLGHKTATWFLEKGGAQDGMDVAPLVLDVNSDLGVQYIQAMALAGEYAYAGRDWVCQTVANIIGGSIIDSVHNHHNFTWLEVHDGQALWVGRKGATPCNPGQRGFIGSSMGENSVIVRGLEHEDHKLSLYSTVHGAGRVMGRMEAKGKIDKKTGEVKRAGKVTQDMMDTWVQNAHVELRGAGVDESPHCYKRLTDVLAEHQGMLEITHTLRPLGVAMAGEREFDPYKD
mgnify:CR=1 FL=1|jgi:tRNA-splicing ligase RtcB